MNRNSEKGPLGNGLFAGRYSGSSFFGVVNFKFLQLAAILIDDDRFDIQ